MTYFATIQHHSISRAPSIGPFASIPEARKAAEDRFGDGFLDHVMVVYQDDMYQQTVASKRIGASKWRVERF